MVKNVKISAEKQEIYLNNKLFVSASDLKAIRKSPKHYLHYKNGGRTETDAMIIGTAVHCAILEADKFKTHYTCFKDSMKPFPDKDYRTVANKEAKEAFHKKNQEIGVVVLDEFQYNQLSGMQNELLSKPIVRNIVKHGKKEHSIYLFDEELDINVKFRPDVFCEKMGFLADVKKTKDASPDGFAKECVNYDSIMQLAFYRDYLNKIYGENTITDVFFIAIEETAPYHSAVYRVKEPDLEYGRYQYLAMIDRLKLCKERNWFPSYEIASDNEQGVLDLNMPSYFQKEIVI